MVLVIDIETRPRDDLMDTHWPQYREKKGIESDGHAALYAEFSQIAAVGGIVLNDDLEPIREKALMAPDLSEESELLRGVASWMGKCVLAGHNLKGFDIPFLARRFLAHGIPIPLDIQVAGRKPWEITHIDTMELLKFGGGMNISLEGACLLLGIPNPKSVCSGAMVAEMCENGQYDELREYVLGDCRATAEVLRALRRCGAF